MTSLPDSGWLTAIHKIAWWVAAAITVTAAIILLLVFFEAPVFSELPHKVAAGIGVVGILSFFLLLFQCIDQATKRRRPRVSRPFDKLSDQQKQFLFHIFRQGSREFNLPAGTGSPRWLEELENWGYIEWHSPMIFTANTPDYYSITEDGWRRLEKGQSGL